jgi:ribosome-binding factor A
MATPRRIRRLCSLIKQRVAEVLQREVKDPRLGLVTITEVELDRELTVCRVFWSVLGGDKERRLNEKALGHARKFIQREVAAVLPTRTVPRLQFVFDEAIEGAIRVQKLIADIRAEEGDESDPPDPDADDRSDPA